MTKENANKGPKSDHVNLVCQTCLMTFSIMYTWRVSRVGNPSAKNAIPAGREKKQNQKEEERGGKQNKTTSTVLTVASRTVSERRWSRNGNEAGIVLAKTCDMRWNSHYLPTETSHGCYNNDQGTAFLWKCRAVQCWKTWLVPVISHRRLFFSAIIWFVSLLIAVSGKGKPQRRKTERAWIEEADKGKDDAIKKKSRKIYWGSNELGFLWMWILVHAQLPVPTIAAGIDKCGVLWSEGRKRDSSGPSYQHGALPVSWGIKWARVSPAPRHLSNGPMAVPLLLPLPLLW